MQRVVRVLLPHLLSGLPLDARTRALSDLNVCAKKVSRGGRSAQVYEFDADVYRHLCAFLKMGPFSEPPADGGA